MATADATCNICLHSYDEEEKRPLLLPCSHSWCQGCLAQIQNTGNKLCPFCRTSWGNVSVADLPFCRQLLPIGSCGKNNDGPALCSQHNSVMQFWCESCDIPLCITCVKNNHGTCEWLLIKDRAQNFKDKHENTISLLKNSLSSEIGESLAVSGEALAAATRLNDRLKVYHEYQQEWQTKAQREIHAFESASNEAQQCEAQDLKEKCNAAEKLYNDRPAALPATLHEYIANLDKLVEGLMADETGTSPLRNTTASAACMKYPSDEFQDGKGWTVTTSAAAAAAASVISITSRRPLFVDITVLNWEQQQFPELMTAIKGTNCDVRLRLFDLLWKPSDVSVAATRSILDAMTTNNNRAVLTHFYGHLDEAAVARLPDTLRSVGLAIRNEEDGNAFKSLIDRAFGKTNGRWKKLWPNLSEIHVSVDKSCSRKDALKAISGVDGVGSYSYASLLNRNGVSTALHLPLATTDDLVRMGEILKTFIGDNLVRPGVTKMLYLPGTSVGANSLLELMKNMDLSHCEVHLPASMAGAVTSKIIASYRLNCSTIVCDLPPM